MRITYIRGILLTLFLAVGSATQVTAQSAWERIKTMPWATVVDVQSPCQMVVRTNGVAVAIRLSGIDPIPTDGRLAHTQVVYAVTQYIHGLMESNSFLLFLEDQQPEGHGERLGTLRDPEYPENLQYSLVADGYAQPGKGADQGMLKAYVLAQRKKLGLWALLSASLQKE
ncbi:MAG: hypothetical protein ACOYOU_04005 [Kiritimatiellia bacterium]